MCRGKLSLRTIARTVHRHSLALHLGRNGAGRLLPVTTKIAPVALVMLTIGRLATRNLPPFVKGGPGGSVSCTTAVQRRKPSPAFVAHRRNRCIAVTHRHC